MSPGDGWRPGHPLRLPLSHRDAAAELVETLGRGQAAQWLACVWAELVKRREAPSTSTSAEREEGGDDAGAT